MTKLPFRHDAEVPSEKVSRYLLNISHPDGAAKAKFFLNRGFDRADPGVLEAALREHAVSNDVAGIRESPELQVTRYETRCSIVTPDGSNPYIRVVWAIVDNSRAPRLVTAYPV